MTKLIYYRYLDANGAIILTPIRHEDMFGIKMVKIIADAGKILTCDGGKTLRNSVLIPEEEADSWVEISK